MDANPREVTFTWIDRSSNQIPSNYYNITSNGLTSYLTFNSTFNTDKVFICSAENSIGKSKDVCVFTLTPAGMEREREGETRKRIKKKVLSE